MNSLSANEKRKLASAMNRLIEKGRYIDIGSFQSAFICKKNRNWVSEKNVDFCNERGELDGSISYPDIYSIKVDTLPWHRLFMVQMEDELGEALPYWDWTVDKDVPDLWEEIRAPMKPPLKSKCDHGQRGGYGNEHEGKGYSNGYGSKGYGTSEAGGHYGDGGGGGYGEGRGYESFVTRKPNIKIDVEKLKRRVKRAFEGDNIADFEKYIPRSLNLERSKKLLILGISPK